MEKPQIAVVGAGLMGIGIATQYVLAGFRTTVQDVDAGRLHEAHAIANRNFDEMIAAGVMTEAQRTAALQLLATSSSLDGIAQAAVVFEAVPEVLSLKHAVYKSLEAALPADAIIASNTSGFDPDSLCAGMAHPERFLVAHFWNPPYLLPLVELVPAAVTRKEHTASLKQQLESAGLTPIVLHKSIPGFIGNRIQFAILREVLHLVRADVASPAEIDMVIQLTLGRRYQFAGPLASADLGGLNTLAEIAKHLMPELAKDEDVIDVMAQHVSRNELGIRSGRGFYDWTPERMAELQARRQRLLQQQNTDQQA